MYTSFPFFLGIFSFFSTLARYHTPHTCIACICIPPFPYFLDVFKKNWQPNLPFVSFPTLTRFCCPICDCVSKPNVDKIANCAQFCPKSFSSISHLPSFASTNSYTFSHFSILRSYYKSFGCRNFSLFYNSSFRLSKKFSAGGTWDQLISWHSRCNCQECNDLENNSIVTRPKLPVVLISPIWVIHF